MRVVRKFCELGNEVLKSQKILRLIIPKVAELLVVFILVPRYCLNLDEGDRTTICVTVCTFCKSAVYEYDVTHTLSKYV